MNKKTRKYKKEDDYFSRRTGSQKKAGAKSISNIKHWLSILLICVIARSFMSANYRTLYDEPDWWYPLFFLTGLTIGILKLKCDKEITWNWKEYLGGAFYSFIYAMGAVLIGASLIIGMEWLNYHTSTNNPAHEEHAIILEKHHYNSRRGPDYIIRVDFDNEELGMRSIYVSRDLYNKVQQNDECLFTIQDGCFNIPVIKNITYK